MPLAWVGSQLCKIRGVCRLGRRDEDGYAGSSKTDAVYVGAPGPNCKRIRRRRHGRASAGSGASAGPAGYGGSRRSPGRAGPAPLVLGGGPDGAAGASVAATQTPLKRAGKASSASLRRDSHNRHDWLPPSPCRALPSAGRWSIQPVRTIRRDGRRTMRTPAVAGHGTGRRTRGGTGYRSLAVSVTPSDGEPRRTGGSACPSPPSTCSWP